MYVILAEDWDDAIDGSTPEESPTKVTIPAGRHEVEEISSPHGYRETWMVLKGTKIGSPDDWPVQPTC